VAMSVHSETDTHTHAHTHRHEHNRTREREHAHLHSVEGVSGAAGTTTRSLHLEVKADSRREAPAVDVGEGVALQYSLRAARRRGATVTHNQRSAEPRAQHTLSSVRSRNTPRMLAPSVRNGGRIELNACWQGSDEAHTGASHVSHVSHVSHASRGKHARQQRVCNSRYDTVRTDTE
jgi:hypothetical protein